MTGRQLAALSLSALLGLASGGLYLLKVSGMERRIRQGEERVEVVVARHNLGIGSTLSRETLNTRSFPREALPQRAVLRQDIGLVRDKKLIHPLPEGDPLLWTDLPEGPRGHRPSEAIPSGYRALALPGDRVRTLTHLLLPGDSVDIVWSYLDEERGRPVTTLLAQRVRVMAVGENTTTGQRGGDHAGDTVTLLLPPPLALRLSYALQCGEVALLARLPDDPGTAPAGRIASAAEAARGGER